MSLADEILSGVAKLSDEVEIRPLKTQTTKQNQLLFFLKPECFLASSSTQRRILDMLLEKFQEFQVEIAGCAAVSGGRLKELMIMDTHYGYINRMSRQASSLLTDVDRKTMLQSLQVPGDLAILGGHEVLDQYSTFSAGSLNVLWSSKRSAKVRGGLYGQVYELDGQPTLVINGFHPSQLEHFTGNDRLVVIFVVNSDLPWAVLRDSMIGDTFPDKAKIGSIRRTLFDHAGELNLSDVSVSNNYCHLSAGPFEALFELRNFLEPLRVADFVLSECKLAEHLKELGYIAELARLLGNPSLATLAQSEDLFSATEGFDSLSAAHFALAFS